ncbi:MAG: glycogen/starch/alpha-glucan phosphorylase, partial [Clostridia bacterium]|nr:glycogen/starch/alpha-glucan phosphorylase [Clostridia bacterium]
MTDYKNPEFIRDSIRGKLSRYFGISESEADSVQMFRAAVLSVRDLLAEKNQRFTDSANRQGAKQVYYMCMEFLVGRSLKLHLSNLGIESLYRDVLAEMGFSLDELYNHEPDPGLGNGGLGRLAACYMDALTSQNYLARGYCILYEYGLFKQRLVEGEQLELPDVWLPDADCWLVPRQDRAFTVRFGGSVREEWRDGHCDIIYEDCDEVEALPFDMFISGGSGNEAVNVL